MEKKTTKWIAGGIPAMLVASALSMHELTTAPKSVQPHTPHTHQEAPNHPDWLHNFSTVVGSTASVTGTSFGVSAFIHQTPPA